MQVHKRELDILKRARAFVQSNLLHFGINKKQEIIRLLYEISKRERVSPENILQDKNLNNFVVIKTYLLKRRFPYAYAHGDISKVYLPKIELNSRLSMPIKKKLSFYPKRIFIEKGLQKSYLAERFRKSFPESTFIEIKSLKDYLKNKRHFGIRDYNNRRDTIFIINEGRDFFKKCPCTKNAYGCGYRIFNLSYGCIFECTYCYLQEYVNSPGIIFPANLDKFFDIFNSYKRPGMRIGTGEFSDSLMLDDVTEYSSQLIDFFSKHKDITFELKTKSSNIGNLLKIKHSGNIVISWSLNPQRIINENELFTSTLMERVNSGLHCVQAGYKIGFHFDPVIYFKGWQKHYGNAIKILFNEIKSEDIAWISIGTLRFNPTLKKTIEIRFPGNKILDEELVLGYDNKLRYPYRLRYNTYNTLIQMMSKYSKKLPIYLCMEEKSMWRDLKLAFHFKKEVGYGGNKS